MSRHLPGYELLELPAGSSSAEAPPTPGSASASAAAAELRTLARAHPRARAAAHACRSYCGSLALVAWHSEPVGVDLERVTATDAGFAASICTPSELDRLGPQLDDPAFVTSLWAGKEALAKALGDALAYDPRRLESPCGWPGAASGRWRCQPLHPAADHVAWLVWSEAQNSSASAASAASMRRLAGRR